MKRRAKLEICHNARGKQRWWYHLKGANGEVMVVSEKFGSYAVYTATAGDYPVKRTDILCGYDADIFKRPVMEAKRYKVLPHLFFPDEAVTIWCDANIRMKVPPQELVDELLGDADMALFKHPFRATPWEEFEALHEQERFKIDWLQAQLYKQEAQYQEEGLFDKAPLYECSFLIRRNNEWVNRAMEAWWAQICRWQWRDQVSLPYVLWKHPLKLRVHALNARDHPAFDYADQYA